MILSGLRLSLSWLTVLPAPAPDVDAAAGRRAIAWSPVVGALLGGIAAGLAWLLHEGGLPPTLVGLLTVAALLLATRGMHIDGLADTMDGLGCYGPPQRAREIMRSGGAGPFAVAAVVVAIGIQSAAFGALAAADSWALIVVAVMSGRVAVVWACARGMGAAAEGSHFGGLVAQSQSPLTGLFWTLLVLMPATGFALPLSTGWQVQCQLAVFIPLLVSAALVRHCVRRFDGISGDVLGAALEVTVSLYAVTTCVHIAR